jgi:pyruvate formate lyase activating enzyme
MRDIPPTPARTLSKARTIAIKNGLRYAYTGNVHDVNGGSTYCPACHNILIGRNWYNLREWNLTPDGRCRFCGETCAGRFHPSPGNWGAKRQPVRLSRYR